MTPPCRRAPLILTLLSLLALPALAQETADTENAKASVAQDITIRGKGGHGPALTRPPSPSEAVVFNEVLRSLKLSRQQYQDEALNQKPIRLIRKFPDSPYLLFSPESFRHPFDHWTFQILAGDRVVKQIEGSSALDTRIGWDGTDMEGALVARADEAYRLRFTGSQKNGEEHTVASSPILLGSMTYKPTLGHLYMDVANSLLFPANGADLLDAAPDYLREMANRMRQHNPQDRPYHLILSQKDPDSRLGRARATALKDFFSAELLVHQKKIVVEIQPITSRGDATTCVVPLDSRWSSQE